MSLNPKENRYRPFANVIVTPPTAEPVTISEMKMHLRLDDDSEDPLIADAINEARVMVENRLGASLMTTSWKLTLDDWPMSPDLHEPEASMQAPYTLFTHAARSISLPRWPLVSITSVTTYDEDSASTAVVVADTFDVDTASRPGRLALQANATWPTANRPTNAIEIVYVAGYGTNRRDVPGPLRRAVRNVAAFLFQHRGDCGSDAKILLGSGALSIIDQYRNVRL